MVAAVRSCLIHRLASDVNSDKPGLIDSPKLNPYKSEHFDRVLPIYQNLFLEQWDTEKKFNSTFQSKAGRVHQGNMDMFQDRTGTLPHYLNMAPYEPLPEYDSSFRKSFTQICLETAQNILSTGEQINVAWSGGLDSTAALFALIAVAPNPKQIKVYCNYNSIIESGNLLEKHIVPRGVDAHLSLPLTTPVFDDGLIVSGYLGDQLYGKYFTLNTAEEFTMRWEDYLNPEQVEVIGQMIEKWPTPVVTVPDYLAFIELNTKWQMGKSNRQRAQPNAHKYIAFYDTVDFQKWSLGNYEEKYISSDPKTFKWATRKFLKQFGLDFYASNKIVQTSHYHIIDDNWVMDLIDGTSLYRKDFE